MHVAPQSPRFLMSLMFGALLAWSSALPACAQGAAAGTHAPRVAFVNTDRILRESAAAKAAQRKLMDDFAPRRQKLQDLQSRIDALRAKLDRDAGTLSAEQRIATQQTYTDLAGRLRDDQQAFGDDLAARRNAEASRLLDRANAAVQQIARRDGDDIVFQSAAYIDPRIDITDAVIKALDAAPAP